MDAPTGNARRVTQQFGPQERTRLAGATSAPGAALADDPVVGWLVVIEGPGRGQARAIGYGMNSIGRNPDQRISLDFGDPQISRHNHAALTYDPRSRQFFLQHGGGPNLTYVDGQVVLAPIAIASGSDIQIGGTRLRFVALCGTQFDWQDQ
jgi:prepilin-type processing-associated H-X9-DG protein